MDIPSLRRRALPVGLFVFTLVIRLVALWRFALTPYAEPVTGDMAFYAEWGKRIAAGELTQFHAFYGQPLYAYLLGGLFSISGFQPVLMAAVQAVFDALTAVVIFKIALCVFRETPRRAAVIGAVAAAAWALFVPAAAYSLLLIPASWTTCAWWLAVWWILRRSADARPPEWLFVATGLGAFAMMSATILFALPLLLYRAATRRSVAAAAAILCGVLLGTAPAWIHNALVARDPVFLSAHSGLNFWIGNNPGANGYPRVPRELPSEQAALLRESVTLAEQTVGRPLKRSEVSVFWSNKARQFIAAEPAAWLRLVSLKAKNFWNAFTYDDLSSITALRDARVIAPGVSFGMIGAFALAGCFVALRIVRARWIVATVLLQMLTLLPVFVNERYRLAAVPGLLIIGVFFLAELWRAVARADWRLSALYTALLAACAWFTTLSPGERALSTLDDYKTAKRHVAAGEYARAELRFRRAFEPMVSASQVSAAVAGGFTESAQEKLRGGDRSAALAMLEQAIRINPSDNRLIELRRRIADEPPSED